MESVKRIGIHCVDVPPSHADEINMGIRKSYLVKQDKDKPFNLGDNICFIEICCGRPCDASDGYKITSLMRITDILQFYTDNWKEIDDWFIVGFEPMTKEEIGKLYEQMEQDKIVEKKKELEETINKKKIANSVCEFCVHCSHIDKDNCVCNKINKSIINYDYCWKNNSHNNCFELNKDYYKEIENNG